MAISVLRDYRCGLAGPTHDMALHLCGPRVRRKADSRERFTDGDGRRNLHLLDLAWYVLSAHILVVEYSTDDKHFSDQVAAGTVNVSYIDETVKTVLRTKFALGLFESAIPARLTYWICLPPHRSVPIPRLPCDTAHTRDAGCVAPNGAGADRPSGESQQRTTHKQGRQIYRPNRPTSRPRHRRSSNHLCVN